jgi:hypothetical protein
MVGNLPGCCALAAIGPRRHRTAEQRDELATSSSRCSEGQRSCGRSRRVRSSRHVNRANRAIGYSVFQNSNGSSKCLLGNLVIPTTPPKMKEASRRSVARLLDA